MENDTPDETYGLQALSQIKYNDKKDLANGVLDDFIILNIDESHHLKEVL